MKRVIGLPFLICLAAFAQDKQPAAVGGGHIPTHGPGAAKTAAPAPPAQGQPKSVRAENFIAVDQKGHPNVPHVDAANDRWVGHDTGPNDPHYHLGRPWAHGRFTGGFGPQHIFTLALDKVDLRLAEWLGGGLDRITFGGFYWNVAPYDYNIPRGWKWNGDRVVVYEDPVHAGWYLAYSPRLGTYAHVEYFGKVERGVAGPETARNAPSEVQPDFENDQVVINAPHPKMHDHKLNRVMIYAFQGGELLHYVDGHTEDLRWQAGEVKWSPASGLHYSEVPPGYGSGGAQPAGRSMGIDIGIKKPGDPRKAVTTALDPLRVDPQGHKLEFQNSQVRVIRVKIAPHQTVPMHEYLLSHVVFYLTDQNVRATSPDGKSEVTRHKAGDFSWDAPAKHKVENLSDAPFEALVVEVRN
jgi:quercetin dioxygenase-like cupin family protein